MAAQYAIQTKGLIKNYGNVRAPLGLDLEVLHTGQMRPVASIMVSDRR